jgi:hypothetical protein
MTKILHRRGSGEPSPEAIDVGEILVDVVNGALYIKQMDEAVVKIGSGVSTMTGNQNVDGGGASAIYTLDQVIDGGSA